MPRPAVIHCTRARAQQADIALVVAMAHAAGEHVGHGLEPAMRMVREAADIVGALVGAELVQHQERVEVGQRRLADDARQLNAGAIAGRAAADRGNDPALFIDGGLHVHLTHDHFPPDGGLN